MKLFYFIMLGATLCYGQNPKELQIHFAGRVKVNAHLSDRKPIQQFFGQQLGRKIESQDDYDRVFFDGGGFVAFVYHSSPTAVLSKDDFINAMQVGLLVPSIQYEAVMSLIKSSGVDPMLPQNPRYQDHSKFYYFHAPGNQVFRIVNTPDLDPSISTEFDHALADRYQADEYGMRKYVLAFLERGPNQSLTKSEREQLQKEHLKNIERMADEGMLSLAGPFYGNDALRGIYIFNVTSIAEAKALTETDPAIKAGSLQMELREWYGTAALMGVNDLHKKIEQKSHIE